MTFVTYLRSALIAGFAGLSCLGSAYGAAIVINDRHTHAIVQNSSTPVTLVAGKNQLDTPTTFDCRSLYGCVVLMTVAYTVGGNVQAVEVCATVDGVSGNPTCDRQLVYGLTREQITIAKGNHTVGTTVTIQQDGLQILSWETDYTIYEVHKQSG